MPVNTVEAVAASGISMRYVQSRVSESEDEAMTSPAVNESPPGIGADERTLFAEARDQLAAMDPRLPQSVTFELCNKTLILNGQVPTYYDKQMVQESLRGLRRNILLENRINVFRGSCSADSSNRTSHNS